MAKITELVKTFKLLNDPEAPDWNVKFVGGALLGITLVAAASTALWFAYQDEALATPAAATAEPAEPRACEPAEMAEEMARLGTSSLPPGHTLPNGCTVSG